MHFVAAGIQQRTVDAAEGLMHVGEATHTRTSLERVYRGKEGERQRGEEAARADRGSKLGQNALLLHTHLHHILLQHEGLLGIERSDHAVQHGKELLPGLSGGRLQRPSPSS